MMGSIFLIQDNDSLVEMNEEPYEKEDHLQSFLERYPTLLAGDQGWGSGMRYCLISFP